MRLASDRFARRRGRGRSCGALQPQLALHLLLCCLQVTHWSLATATTTTTGAADDHYYYSHQDDHHHDHHHDHHRHHNGTNYNASTSAAASAAAWRQQGSSLPCGVTKLYTRRSMDGPAGARATDVAQPWELDPLAEEPGPPGAAGACRAKGRIFAGKNSRPGELSYQLKMEAAAGFRVFLCGAVLIGDSWALTAGHCVADVVRRRGRARVVAAEHSISDRGEREILVDVERIFLHPQFLAADFPRFVVRNDIAILRLARPIEPRITPNGFGSVNRVCLPPASVRYGRRERVTMSGWGLVNRWGFGANVLQKLTYMAEMYAPNTQFICTIPNFGSGQGTCQGDSGGPMVRWNKAGRLWQAELIGLTSYGPSGCGRLNAYSCFTRVSTYRNWIKSITGL